MTTEAALPTAAQATAPAAEVGAQPTEQLATTTEQAEPQNPQKQEGEQTEKPTEKREKTPEERENARLRRRVDNLTRRLYQGQSSPPQQGVQNGTNGSAQAADEPVTLSRAELQKLIRQEAEVMAPVINRQQSEIEHRTGIVQGLEKQWGKEKFDAYASDLDDAFGGLADQSGKPKAATDAIFESEMPAALIEYLADPDNADEAEAISRMSAVQAGRAVAKLETKLGSALATKKAEAKPQPSKAAAPIENLRGGGTINGMPDPSDTKAYMKWANKQEFGR